jgi:hypothetical protein
MNSASISLHTGKYHYPIANSIDCSALHAIKYAPGTRIPGLLVH